MDAFATYLSLAVFPERLEFGDRNVCYDCTTLQAGPLTELRPVNRSCANTYIRPDFCECAGESPKWKDLQDNEDVMARVSKIVNRVCEQVNKNFRSGVYLSWGQ
eukprot:TRINITY_DN12645_c0_g1_i1.p1 TRINITY_DN12645_c0_g1~~TRINITY_DN12645_c0_g1_i1.p1  ORF type:complete len:104 (+),score=14.05 TRINITY_DN12645_c0_g1_i1:236-547(+)